MDENKFEAAARLLKALRKLDEREDSALDGVRVRYEEKRRALVDAVPEDVRAMVEAERKAEG